MNWRIQPPVYSPLSLGAIVAGAGAWLGGSSPAADRLAGDLAREFGAGQVLLTDSGTTALALAIRSAAGDGLVALPAYGCYDLATAVDTAGARALLYDVDPDTLGPDWPSLERVLSRGARVVVAVHLFGVPVDLPRIIALAAKAGAVVIEDAAMGAGATRQGVPAGAGAPLAVLSFGRGKGVTGGRGGALLLRQPVDELISAGADSTSIGELLPLLAQWLLARPSLYGLPARLPFLGLGETVYRPPQPARSISRVAVAVLGRGRAMRELEAATRRRNAQRLIVAAQRGADARPVTIEPTSAPGYLRLPLVMAPPTRDRRLGSESRALGIMPGYPGSLDTLARFRDRLANASDGFPGAHALASGLITAPTHSLLTEPDLLRLERWLGR